MKEQFQNIILVTFLISGPLTLAQTDYQVDGEVPDAEIVIEKERKIELEKEYKLYEFIKWRPERSKPTPTPSEFKWYIYDVANEPMEFKPAKATMAEKEQSYQHYGKVGFGNYTSPLVDISLTTNGDANRMGGVNIKHESFGTGEIDGKNSGSVATEANLYGAIIREKIKLESAVNYRLEKNYYYGYQEGTVVNNDDIKHNANFLNLELNATDNELEDVWEYKIGVGFKHYSDNFDAKENTFETNFGIGYKEKFYLDGELAVGSYEDLGIDDSRSYFRFNPYYRVQWQALTIDAGLSVNLQNDDYPDLGNTRISPYAKATYELADNYTLNAKLDGGYSFNSIFQLAKDVFMLNQSIGLANMERIIDLSVGVDGSPIEKLSFHADLGYQAVRYLPVFINNEFDQSRLDLGYDSQSSIFIINLSSNYKLNESHDLTLGGKFNFYSLDDIEKAYHLPAAELLVAGDHQFIPKFNIKWQFALVNGLTARDQTSDENIDLDTISKLDISLHYQLKEQWGIFLLGENLINQNYSRYMNYSQRGLQIKGGVTFRL